MVNHSNELILNEPQKCLFCGRCAIRIDSFILQPKTEEALKNARELIQSDPSYNMIRKGDKEIFYKRVYLPLCEKCYNIKHLILQWDYAIFAIGILSGIAAVVFVYSFLEPIFNKAMESMGDYILRKLVGYFFVFINLATFFIGAFIVILIPDCMVAGFKFLVLYLRSGFRTEKQCIKAYDSILPILDEGWTPGSE